MGVIAILREPSSVGVTNKAVAFVTSITEQSVSNHSQIYSST